MMRELIDVVIGCTLKIKYNLYYILRVAPPCLNTDGPVVSLTSYGRRVRNCVYHTIYCIFEQNEKPSNIVLWLGEEEWNDNRLPKKLLFLKKHGLQIRYRKDLRSFTKLIYALEEFRGNVIITVDDDLVYSRDAIRKLLRMRKSNPDCVCTGRCKEPEWEIPYEKFKPYRNWSIVKSTEDMPHMALGYGAVLYPPHCFDNEVFNVDVIKQYCPFADDVWFWAMELKNGTRVVVSDKEIRVYPIDIFYQFFHNNSALSQINVSRDKNDEQIQSIMDLYGLWNVIKKRNHD